MRRNLALTDFLKVVLKIAALLVALATASPGPVAAQGNRWGADYFPNLPVVTQDGKTLHFYDDVIKGKIVVISFIYTSCPDICPLTTARLSQVEDKFKDVMGRDLFFVSITVDPENDTPEKLKEFSSAFGTGPGWLFLTGKPADIREINFKLGDKSRSLSDHRNEIAIGNDATGEWTRNTVFGDIDRLVMDIRSMDPKWRDQERVVEYNPASNTGFKIGLEPGQALFKKICAPCHTIGVGDRVGPDLRGVTERRSRDWLARFIRHPQQVRAEKDPVTVALAEKFPGVRMPNLGMSEVDAIDLIYYLQSETSRLAEGAQGVPAAANQDTAMHEHHHEP
jgi:cytochrome oxidase Cu insertion factor (SCO1/SenC/PrrC family)/mono/diheme cytochrome c family protein